MPPWTGPKIFTPSSVVSGTYFTYMPISKPIQERASATATTRNAVAAVRGVTTSILPERSAQVRPPTGRDFIPHREAAGEPELLQLAHVPLERERLAPQRGGEIRRADAGTIGDQAQHVPGPRLVADGVPTVEPVVDGAAVLVTQHRLLPQGDPRIVAFEAHLHPVHPRAVPSLEQPVQLGQRPHARTDGVLLGEHRGIDLVDGFDADDARGRALRAARPHAGAVPSAEDERDGPVRDPCGGGRADQHERMVTGSGSCGDWRGGSSASCCGAGWPTSALISSLRRSPGWARRGPRPMPPTPGGKPSSTPRGRPGGFAYGRRCSARPTSWRTAASAIWTCRSAAGRCRCGRTSTGRCSAGPVARS